MSNEGAESLFLDTNILVYANVAQAPLHQLARRTIEQYDTAGYMFWISRQIVREYMTTVTRRSYRSWHVQTRPHSWRVYTDASHV